MKNNILYLIVAVAAVMVLRWTILNSGLQSFGGDTVKWAAPAINFALHGFSKLDFLPTTSLGNYDVETGGRVTYLHWPFLPSYMLAGFVKVFGDANWALRLLPLLLNLVSAVYIYLITARIFNSVSWGLFGSTVFLLLPGGLYYAFQVCDTQFWLAGSIAGFFHLERWRSQYNLLDKIASILWLLFACACSWFGYLALVVACGFLIADATQHKTEEKWYFIVQSPLPWLAAGLVMILSVYIALLVNALGVDGLIATYGNRWQQWTGGVVVSQNIPNGNLWDVFGGAIHFRARMLLEQCLGIHIPLYLSLPVAITTALFLVLFIIHSIAARDAIKSKCLSTIIYFGSFYLLYAMLFPSHMARFSHNFTTQMLAPVFVVLIVYGVWWSTGVFEKIYVIHRVKYLPVALLTVLLLSMSWSYRLNNPTLHLSRAEIIEGARLFGSTISNQTTPVDLILSNYHGWRYDNNIMRFTARRTVKLKQLDKVKVHAYIRDSQFKGVVYFYRHGKDKNSKEVKELTHFLNQNSKSATPSDSPDSYPNLVMYRLK